PITHTLLSHREQEVIQLLAKGMRDREIAQKLFISDRTVKFHINNVVSDITPNTNCKQYGVGFYPYRQPPWLPWLAEVPA
ncbi:MAG: helix-turn-helix transcriptional regulator, partial [Cyanobacteria bacterium P01_A01_bin.83]